MKKYFKKQNNGFTLIELLVTISIISLLSSIVFTIAGVMQGMSETLTKSGQVSSSAVTTSTISSMYPFPFALQDAMSFALHQLCVMGVREVTATTGSCPA